MDVLESRGTIQNLPDELLLEIFQFMNPEELVICTSNVCIRWRNVVNTSKLWKNLAYKPPSSVSDDKIMSMLQCMPHLRIFIFNSNCSKVNEIINVLCSNCRFLQTLVCDSVFITVQCLRKIIYCLPDLEYFQLSQWQIIDDRSLYFLSKMKNLKKLTNVNVGPASTYTHPNTNVFPALEHIELTAYCTDDIRIHEGQINEWDPCHFLHLVPQLKNLKHLSIDFRMLHFSGFESVFQNMKNLSNLETLSLKSLFHSNEDIVTKVFESSTFLKLWKLDLCSCLNINVKTVQAIRISCPLVQELHFGRCLNFDDDCAKELVGFSELYCLDLSCCARVTEHGLAYLAQCPKLETLDLSWSHIVPHRTLSVLSSLPHLKALLLNHTDIRHEDIVEFLFSCQHVVYLGLYCCNGIDGNIIQDTMPKCKICHHCIQEVKSPCSRMLKIN